MSNSFIFAHPEQEVTLENRSRLVAVLNNTRQMNDVIQKTAANYQNTLPPENYQNLSAQNTPLTEIDMVRQFLEGYVNDANKLNAEELTLKEELDKATKQRNLLIGLGIAAGVILLIIIMASL
jgi:hypothetical protein